MLSRGHRLQVGAQGIVGYVTGSGKSRIALDTGADATFFSNPDLPNTHSEMAVPLISGGKIIGALDIQSEQTNAFTQEDVDVVQTLADQVSIAIENARQFDATQKMLAESETMYRQYVRQEWRRQTTNDKLLGFRFSVAGAAPLKQRLEASQTKLAVETGKTHIETSAHGDQATISVPIKLRDEVIGVLNIRHPEKRAWSQDEVSLVQAVAERVAVSAENARLLEDSQRRAAKEQAIGEISSKIGASINLRNIMQTAVEELSKTLSGSQVSIRLKSNKK
jgi:GAF domain-containing protein